MTTDRFITDTPETDNHFPNDDFFLDVNNLCNDMTGEDVDPKSSASATAVPYVLFFFLFEVLPQFLVLVFVLDMLRSTSYIQLALLSALDMFGYSSYMQMLFTFFPSDCMTCFIAVILVMLYLVFLLIKSFGKSLIFPTIQKP